MNGTARTTKISNNGIFASESEALSTILGRIVERFDPACVWLFGSRARGTARPDSDFDLLVVAKPGGTFGSDDYKRLYEPVVGLGVGCDIVPCSAEDFEEGNAIKTSLIAQIVGGEGKKLYDAEAR